MIISDLVVDYVSFDDDDKEISAIAISYKDKNGHEQRRWLEKPRRIGRWVDIEAYYEAQEAKCSICGQLMTTPAGKSMSYCPRCGAKMDESEVKENDKKRSAGTD